MLFQYCVDSTSLQTHENTARDLCIYMYVSHTKASGLLWLLGLLDRIQRYEYIYIYI